MATYRIQTTGGTYEVKTADDSAPTGPQWSDLPGNALEGLKETPQTALGLANAATMGLDLTDPEALINSGVQALTGTPLSQTNAGQAVGSVAQGAQNTVQGLSDLVHNPGQTIKNEIIQHPISTAALLAGGVSGAAEDALGTVGKYAGRFGEDQAVKALGRVPPGMEADAARALARKANDMGLLDADMGPLGRKETVDAMNDQAGRDLGDLRAQASEAGPVRTGQQMADAIRERLGEDYQAGGTNFDQTQALERELQNIQSMPSTTPADFATRASDMYSKAKGKGFAVPTNVDTDVAGALAHLNDEDIATRLGDKAQQYGDFKQTFGDTSDLQNIIERGEKRSLNRPGSHTMLEAGGKFLDELGAHKIGAKLGMGVGDALESGAQMVRPTGTAGVVSSIMSRITTNPQSLGKFAAPLMQAAQGGPQGIAATHYVLSMQHPEYNAMWQSDNQDDNNR